MPLLIRAFFNLDDQPQPLPADIPAGMSALFSSEAEAYGGCRDQYRPISETLALRVRRFRAFDLEVVSLMPTRQSGLVVRVCPSSSNS